MGKFPPIGLSLEVNVNPRPSEPFVNSNSIIRPILRVFTAINTLLPVCVIIGVFFVGDTVATLVQGTIPRKQKEFRINPQKYIFKFKILIN